MASEAEMLAYLYRREKEREANERNAAAAAQAHIDAQRFYGLPVYQTQASWRDDFGFRALNEHRVPDRRGNPLFPPFDP